MPPDRSGGARDRLHGLEPPPAGFPGRLSGDMEN
jgi:hypothetical protein